MKELQMILDTVQALGSIGQTLFIWWWVKSFAIQILWLGLAYLVLKYSHDLLRRIGIARSFRDILFPSEAGTPISLREKRKVSNALHQYLAIRDTYRAGKTFVEPLLSRKEFLELIRLIEEGRDN